MSGRNENREIDVVKAVLLTEAIIQMVRNGITDSRFPLNKMLWALSVYTETGRVNTEGHKKRWHRISVAAVKSRILLGDELWSKKEHTVFDHILPIDALYLKLVSLRNDLDLRRALEVIGEYPPVVITTAENQDINQRGFKKTGSPEERYTNIFINGFRLKSEHAGPHIERALKFASSGR